MQTLLSIVIIILFFINKTQISIAALNALNIWSKTLFPVLFPTFILCDYLLSTKLINIIIKYFSKLYYKIFKTNGYGLYIFFISLIAGTPTNVKNLKLLYDNKLINEYELNKIVSTCIFFNPFFVLKYTSLKILLIIWISNIITAFIFKNYYISSYSTSRIKEIDFNLNTSIEKNLNIIINILGTITIFMCLSSIININNNYINYLISGLFEITCGLSKNYFFNKTNFLLPYLQLLILSFGGLSIVFQIKSILKDTYFDYKFYIKCRLLAAFSGLLICSIT